MGAGAAAAGLCGRGEVGLNLVQNGRAAGGRGWKIARRKEQEGIT